MRDLLFIGFNKRLPSIPICFAFDMEKKHMVGWVAGEPNSTEVPGEWDVSIFVDPQVRQQGIGRELLTRLIKKNKIKKLRVSPWNRESAEFFRKMGARDYELDKPLNPRMWQKDSDRVDPQIAYIMGQTLVNPETKNKIKVSTALKYPDDHPAKKLAQRMVSRK